MSEFNATTKIAVVAGNMSGPGNLDGPVAIARFYRPAGVVFDKAGNLFVTDSGNHIIRKITPEGVVSTFAGKSGATGETDGKGTKAKFYSPQGITIDDDGNLYVADRFNHSVRKVSTDGVVSTIAGGRGHSDGDGDADLSAKIGDLDGIAIDSKNNIYVAGDCTICKISSSGIVTTFAGSVGKSGVVDGVGSAARFVGANGIAIDSTGNIYVCDFGSIRKITPSGEVTTFIGKKDTSDHSQGKHDALDIRSAMGIMFDSADNMYMTILYHAIYKISPKGDITLFAGVPWESGSRDGPANTARFSQPNGLAIDKAGSIYIADSENNSIRKVMPDGKVVTITGSVEKKSIIDDVGTAANFNTPTNMAVDKEGNLYVVDYESLLRKITPTGSVTTFSKNDWNVINRGGTGFDLKRSGFRTVPGVTTDRNSNVYVTDCSSRNRTGGGGYSMWPRFMSPGVDDDKIKIISPCGEVSTVRVRKGKVGYLQGIATDDNGNIYVVDKGRSLILKVTPKKIFSASVKVIAGKEYELGDADGEGDVARFRGPTNIARDKDGNLYVVDSSNYTIRKITPEGRVTTLAGKAGKSGVVDGVGADAMFNEPRGIAVDNRGNIYVAEYYGNVIRKITKEGVVSTFVGQNRKKGFIPGDLPGVLVRPYGVVVHDNDLYITMLHGVVVVKNITKPSI